MSNVKAFHEAPLPLFEGLEALTELSAGKTPSYLKDHRKRLRERFNAGGPDAVADYELLELLLFRAIPRQDVKPLARRLLETFGDFNGLRTILVTSQRERVVRTMVERTLAYALCRKLEYYDRPTIDSIVSQLKSNSATFHDLFIAVATSLPFTKTTFRSN